MYYIIIIIILIYLLKKTPIINKNIIDKNIINKNIIIVYYIYLNEHNNWKNIILGQLYDINESGILNNNLNVKIEIVISANNNINLINNSINIINNYFNKILFNNYNIETYNINHYEYPGINKLYLLSKIYQNYYFIYIHSKGMSNNKGFRSLDNIKLTRNIIYPWYKIINILNDNNNINKITISCSKEGFAWFNFFWAKSSYLSNLKPPIITNNRYYYESWLGYNGSNSFTDCYNIINPKKQFYSQSEAINLL